MNTTTISKFIILTLSLSIQQIANANINAECSGREQILTPTEIMQEKIKRVHFKMRGNKNVMNLVSDDLEIGNATAIKSSSINKIYKGRVDCNTILNSGAITEMACPNIVASLVLNNEGQILNAQSNPPLFETFKASLVIVHPETRRVLSKAIYECQTTIVTDKILK